MYVRAHLRTHAPTPTPPPPLPQATACESNTALTQVAEFMGWTTGDESLQFCFDVDSLDRFQFDDRRSTVQSLRSSLTAIYGSVLIVSAYHAALFHLSGT